MSAEVRPEMEKRPRRRVRLCKHCLVTAVRYRSPSSGKLRSDRHHDLCTVCFWRLVRKVNREQR